MGIFSGFLVAFDLDYGTTIKKKQEIKQFITENDGRFSFVLNKQCNLLVSNVKDAENSYKCRVAIKNNIPVVSINYIYDCVNQVKALEVKKYQIIADSSTRHFNKGIITTLNNDESKPKLVNAIKVWKNDDANMPHFDENNYEILDFACFMGVGQVLGKQSKKPFSVLELHASNIKEQVLNKEKISFRICVQYGFIIQDNRDTNKDKREYIFTDDSDVAMNNFLKLYNQQTDGFNNMARVSDLPHGDVGSKKLQMKLNTKRLLEHLEDNEVERLVDEIWRESIGCLEDIVHQSCLSLKLSEIGEAETILVQLRTTLNNEGVEKSVLDNLENDFYKVIPHHDRAKVKLDNKRDVSKKFELCQLLRDIVSVSEDSSTRSTIDSKYKALRCAIKSLDDEEFDGIKNFVESSILNPRETNESEGICIQRIFRVIRPIESLNFASQLGGVISMFHATKPENVLGILSRGLLLPRVVVDELGGALTDVGRLGGGIYFADSISTSLKYSKPSETSGHRFMFVSSVALGSCKDYLIQDSTLESSPPGFDSCHAVSKSRNGRSVFEDDEYVIYSTNQQRLEYLVEFKVDRDPAGVVRRSLSCDYDRVSMDTVVDQETDLSDKLIKLCTVNPKDILKVKDPMENLKVGLLSKDSKMSIPLKGVHVFVKMVDLVAEVTVLQRYLNDNDGGNSEVKYVFPLDEDAAVYGFEAFINGKHIIGKVKEKEQARLEYKEAVEKGHGAYLMDQDERVQNLFVMNVGNLPPGVEAIIKVSYVTQLTVEDGDICFNLPACVAPWKENENFEIQTQDQTNTFKVKPSPLIKTNVQVSIEMPFEIKRISSPTHNIRIKKTETKAVIETLKNQPLNMGFKLLVMLSDVHVPRMWVEQHQEMNHSRACMVTFYPEFDATKLTSQEVIFLVDQSNSMFQPLDSRAMISARQILLLFLQQLPNESLFNVILFGSDFSKLFSWCKPKSDETIENANNFLKNNSKSMGRSAINDLLYIFHLLTSPTTTRNIIIITDGYLDDESDVFRRVKNFSPKTRVFGVGVGPAANNHFLQNLSRVGGGNHEYFDDGIKSKWIGKVNDLLAKTTQPSVSEVTVDWQNFGEAGSIVQAPSHISSIFSGSRQVIFGFVPNCTMATLKANIGGQEISTVVSTSDLNITSGIMIHKLTARAVIQDWMYGMMAEDKLEDDVMKRIKKQFMINLSLKHSIVTKYTSFVAIEEREKDEDRNELNVNELLETNSVDFLPYVGWDSGVCTVKLTLKDGSVLNVECPSTATADELMILLEHRTPGYGKLKLIDPQFKSTVCLNEYENAWECLSAFPSGFACLPLADEFEFENLMTMPATSLSKSSILRKQKDSCFNQKMVAPEDIELSPNFPIVDHSHLKIRSRIMKKFKSDTARNVCRLSPSYAYRRFRKLSPSYDVSSHVHTLVAPQYNDVSSHVHTLVAPHDDHDDDDDDRGFGLFEDDLEVIQKPQHDQHYNEEHEKLSVQNFCMEAVVRSTEKEFEKMLEKIIPGEEFSQASSPCAVEESEAGSGHYEMDIAVASPEYDDDNDYGFALFDDEEKPVQKPQHEEIILTPGHLFAKKRSLIKDLPPPPPQPHISAPIFYGRAPGDIPSLAPRAFEFRPPTTFAMDMSERSIGFGSSSYFGAQLGGVSQTCFDTQGAVGATFGSSAVASVVRQSQQLQDIGYCKSSEESFAKDGICEKLDSYQSDVRENLMDLLQVDEGTGHMYWEMTDELGTLLGFNSALIKGQIIGQFSHVYTENINSMKDLSRLFATMVSLQHIVKRYNEDIDELTVLEQQEFAQQMLKIFVLKRAQDLLAVFYFCFEMLKNHLMFVEKFVNSMWMEAVEFFDDLKANVFQQKLMH